MKTSLSMFPQRKSNDWSIDWWSITNKHPKQPALHPDCLIYWYWICIGQTAFFQKSSAESTLPRICSACQHKNKQLCQLYQFQVLYNSYNTWSKKQLNVENKLKCASTSRSSSKNKIMMASHTAETVNETKPVTTFRSPLYNSQDSTKVLNIEKSARYFFAWSFANSPIFIGYCFP